MLPATSAGQKSCIWKSCLLTWVHSLLNIILISWFIIWPSKVYGWWAMCASLPSRRLVRPTVVTRVTNPWHVSTSVEHKHTHRQNMSHDLQSPVRQGFSASGAYSIGWRCLVSVLRGPCRRLVVLVVAEQKPQVQVGERDDSATPSCRTQRHLHNWRVFKRY